MNKVNKTCWCCSLVEEIDKYSIPNIQCKKCSLYVLCEYRIEQQSGKASQEGLFFSWTLKTELSTSGNMDGEIPIVKLFI